MGPFWGRASDVDLTVPVGRPSVEQRARTYTPISAVLFLHFRVIPARSDPSTLKATKCKNFGFGV